MTEQMRDGSRLRVGVLLYTLLSLMCVAARAHAQAASDVANPPAAPQMPGDRMAIRIGSGDLLDVTVFDTPELSATKVRVSQDGYIKLPIMGDASVKDLSPLEASTLIESNLRQAQIMLAPHVTVSIVEYATQGIRVLGQVKSPGTYVLLGPHSLYDALSVAGGPTQDEGANIVITHQNDITHPTIVQVNSANYSQVQLTTPVMPGDVIVVSHAQSVYVVGDVGRPGEFLLERGRSLSVLEAVARAAGLNETAATSSASILRKTGDGAVTIPVNFKRIQRNTSANVAMEPGDVLIVPRSTLKQTLDYAIPYAAGSVITAAAAVAIR